MPRGKRKSKHHGRITLAIGVAHKGKYGTLTKGAIAGDTAERKCPKHGWAKHILRVEKGNNNRRWRCYQCDIEHTTKMRKGRRKTLIAAAGGKCIRCGYNGCIAALQFHHRDPAEKSFGLSVRNMSYFSSAKLKTEAAKCNLLCGNCHAELEYKTVISQKSAQFLYTGNRFTSYKACPIHGNTLFVQDRPGAWRCPQCSLEAVIRRRRKVKDILIEEAGGKCQQCGYSKYRGALQFHHRDPSQKEFGLASVGSLGIEKQREEVKKCDLLCNNCHAEHHANN